MPTWLLGVLTAVAAFATAVTSTVQPVSSVDLSRYAGRWFEIARYPNRFQKACAGDVQAEYALLPNGRVRVVNQCRQADGKPIVAEGIARLVDPRGAASRLKVRFAPAVLSFIPAVWGDYWIIGLASDYSYAVVGDPSREYLWILSRTAQMDPATYAKAVDAAVTNGFDPERLVKTRHSTTD